MARLTALSDLTHADAAAFVLLDARSAAKRQSWPLDNGAFAVATSLDDLPRDRVVLVVDESQDDATALCDRLVTAGFDATALGGGLRAWTGAIVCERIDRYPSGNVIVFRRPARNVRSYAYVARDACVVIDASGSAAAILTALRPYGIPHAVVETAFHRDRLSSGPEAAVRAEAPYLVPPAGDDALAVRGHRRVEERCRIDGLSIEPIGAGGNVRVATEHFAIGCSEDATYRTCCGDGRGGSGVYEKVNRGLLVVNDLQRDALEFGPPGCLPP